MKLTPPITITVTASGNGLGHPGDAWGLVVGAGLRLNFPMIAQGDYFQGEVNYTQGALRYLNQPTQGNYEAEQSNNAAYGIMSRLRLWLPTAGAAVIRYGNFDDEL